jgi:hypothetical protein
MRQYLEVPIFRQRYRQIDSVIGTEISKTTEKKQWRARSSNCWCECGRKSRREMAFQRDRGVVRRTKQNLKEQAMEIYDGVLREAAKKVCFLSA